MFRPVAVEEIPDLWRYVEHGLIRIRRRCKAPWHESQIKAHLLQGRASLFIRQEGFVVLERCVEPITFEPYLNVWFMYFAPGKAYPMREELVKWLDGMKKQAKCCWWQFASPREEWAEVIKPYCEKVMTTWRRI